MSPSDSRSKRKAKAPDFRTARFALRLKQSKIEGFGVFSTARIPARRLVVEYTGEKITVKEAVRRFWRMMRGHGAKHAYWFRLDKKRYVLDGAVGGCGAEYINHSCDPNLFTRRARGRILLYSRRAIRRGEELTLDYRFSAESSRVECHCGSPRCRGTINKLK